MLQSSYMKRGFVGMGVQGELLLMVEAKTRAWRRLYSQITESSEQWYRHIILSLTALSSAATILLSIRSQNTAVRSLRNGRNIFRLFFGQIGSPFGVQLDISLLNWCMGGNVCCRSLFL